MNARIRETLNDLKNRRWDRISPADVEQLESGVKALAYLVDKLDQIAEDPSFKNVWVMYHVHGGRYTGPSYVLELDAARAFTR